MNKLNLVVGKEERESIIQEATERILLALPEVIGNLMMNYASKMKVKEEFYEKHPHLRQHSEKVAAIIERLENEDPSKPLDDILDRALPEIEKAMGMDLNMDRVDHPRTNYQGEF